MSVFLLSRGQDGQDLADRADHELAAALSRAGHRVVVENCDIDLPSAPAFGHGLAARWEDERPDVVIARDWLAGLAAQVAGREAGVPVITRMGALTRSKRDPGRARLEAAIARGSDLVLAGSSEQAEKLAALGVPRKQILVIPLGVDTTTYTDIGPAWSRASRRRLVAADDLGSAEALGALIAALPALPFCELLVISPQTSNLAEHPMARELVAAAHHRQVALDSYGLSAADRARARFAWDVIAETTARAVEDVLAARWGSAAAS